MSPEGKIHKLGSAEMVHAPQEGIRATPFSWRDPESIPRRQWIHGRHAIRRYVSATAADGGVGKTALALTEAAAVVTGRPLLNDGKVQKCPVWYIGLEDDRDEYERRIAATVLAHHLKPGDLRGGFFWDSGREQDFVIMREDRSGLVLAEPVIAGVIRRVKEHGIGLLIIDPFIASHAVSENDNGKIDAVCRQWAHIADEGNCAVELNHHTRKSNGEAELSADDLRGAGAFSRAVRSVRLLAPMKKDDAKRAGVDNRRRFFRVLAGAKANMALHPDEGAWRELVTIDLGNGDEHHPADHVQAAAAWQFPDAADECSQDQLTVILDQLRSGEWRESSQAAQWAGNAVAAVLGLNIEGDDSARASVKAALRKWTREGIIQSVERTDEKTRKPFKFIVPGAG